MTVISTSPEATYLTKTNIVYPGAAAAKTAAEAKARTDIGVVLNATAVTGGSIK